MNDMEITVFLVSNPVFALVFYRIGRRIIKKYYDIALPAMPKGIKYFLDRDMEDAYHKQRIIWFLAILGAVFCTALLVGLVSGELKLP